MDTETFYDPHISYHFIRQRINHLLVKAANYPLVVICAGAGYGKTSAVCDFTRGASANIGWTQLTERDNIGERFWENYTSRAALSNPVFGKMVKTLGFPDTDDKINRFHTIAKAQFEGKPHIHVFDDFHFIDDPAVIYFAESCINGLPQGSSLFFIARSASNMNIASLVSKGHLFDVGEDDLRFTESELSGFFKQQGISPHPDELREIFEDTGGWAFAVNLVVRSYQKAPSYKGFLRNAMKTNVFTLMKVEYTSGMSEGLQRFMIRLSLIENLSVELVGLLCGGDASLLSELKRQNSYVRLDAYTNSYLIHQLFLEFLRDKQDLLTQEEKTETYRIAADWCNANGIKVDALTYYEKTGDYAAIVGIFHDLPMQIPYDIARYTTEMFDRAPEEAFDSVPLLAAMRVRSAMRLGLMRQAEAYIDHYEKRFLSLPEDSLLRNHTLGGLYYCKGIMQTMLCTTEDRYDFDLSFKSMCECLTLTPIDPRSVSGYPVGPWISLVGSERKGAQQAYIEALSRSESYISNCLFGTMTGMTDLARGELLFHQGRVSDSEPLFVYGVERAQEHAQFEIAHIGLGYLLHIAVFQGNFEKAEQMLKDMRGLLDENSYNNRFIVYDISLGWYYTYLEMPELVPGWLKDKFAAYNHAYFPENFGNRIKAQFHYITRNYAPLLAYMREQRQRESILYGRLEMLAMEACVYYLIKERRKALEVLKEAYDIAAPNGITMAFINRGKDMRTLCSAALKEHGCGVPPDWLEMVRSKSSSYAKRQSHIIAEYKRAYYINEGTPMTKREIDIITDLSHGLSHTEIAVNRNISVNTVKTTISTIHKKLKTENTADMIRASVRDKLI